MRHFEIKHGLLTVYENVDPKSPPAGIAIVGHVMKRAQQLESINVVLDTASPTEIEATVRLLLAHTHIYKNIEELQAKWLPIKTDKLFSEAFIKGEKRIEHIDLVFHNNRSYTASLCLRASCVYSVPQSVMYPDYSVIVKNHLALSLPSIVEKIKIEQELEFNQKTQKRRSTHSNKSSAVSLTPEQSNLLSLENTNKAAFKI